MIRLVLALLASGLLSAALPARAEIDNCTNITSLPAVISSQGVYCLKQDLSTAVISGAAITITANNVTLDCNDWKIGGLAAGASTQTSGIRATNRRNIVVRNCGIRGFRHGIDLDGENSAYHLIQDNRVDLSTRRGILAMGDGTTVRGNRIYDTGGSEVEVHGITTVHSATLIDNTVHGVNAVTTTVGIFVNSLTNERASFASQNRVSGLQGGGFIYGIYALGRVTVSGNMVSHAVTPNSSHAGIRCHNGPSHGIAQNNLLSGFSNPALPVTNCSISGNTSTI